MIPPAPCSWSWPARLDRLPRAMPRFCADLRQQDKGRRYRELAGLHAAIPGEDDLSHFRRRVGRRGHRGRFGRLCRPLPGLWPDHGRTPRHGWPAGALLLPLQGLCLLQSGLPAAPVGRGQSARALPTTGKRTKRRIRCPFPEVVQKVRQATTKQGKPREPKWPSWRSTMDPQTASRRRPSALELLSLPTDQLPPLRIQWSHLTKARRESSGPAKVLHLEARVGYHIDNKNPDRTRLRLPAPNDHQY